MRPIRSLLLAPALMVLSSLLSAQISPTQPTDLSANHRSGQTFLTWTESVDTSVLTYRVYRHDSPITTANLALASMVYEVTRGSNRFYADRHYLTATNTWKARYVDRYVLTDLGPELLETQEFLVWTLAEEDFGGGSSGDGYYAVTSVDDLGNENATDLLAGNVTGPVAESIDAPQPVLTKDLLSGRCKIYTQFMDLRNFNVTHAAPNLLSAYYGFSPTDPEVLNAKQYGFTYAVFPPVSHMGCTHSADYSVLVCLHGYGGYAIRPWTFDPDPAWCNTFRIYPIDVTNTWWFGNARDHDFRVDLAPLSGDTVVNYTEQRVLRMIRDLKASPTYGSVVDEERVYIRGHSMGGSGALAYALRYPNVFAGAHASQPMTNYITDGDGGGTDWRPDLEIKWGTVAEELPMLSDAMDGLADHLKQYDGTPTWEWQNHQQQLIDRRGEDFVPFGIDHGIPDLVIEWATQGLPFYEPLNEASICWSGQVTNDLHVSSDLASLPASMAKTPAGHPFAGFMVKRSESLPGFRDATGNNALPPVGSGAYNEFIEWSSSWGPWDGQPLDTALEWQISLRTTDASIHTADIIPRRLQSFSTTAGWGYAWSNTRVSDGVEIASGTVMADADGLVIVPDVEITPSGNRVRVAPLLSGSPAQISVSAGGAQTLALDCGDDLAGKLALVLGSVSGTSPGVPVNSSLTLPLNLDPYFILTLNQPNSAFLTPSLAGLDPVGNMVTTFTLGAGIAPGLVGLAAHHAFAVIDSLGGSAVITAVSNPVSVSFDP